MRSIRMLKPSRATLMGWAFPLVLLSGVGFMGAVRGGQTGSDIAWTSDFNAALQQAQRMQRPLLIEFHAPGCVWCAKMEAETYPDARVTELSRRFVCARLDGDVEIAAARRYHILEYPTTVFADAQGNALSKLNGYTPPARFAAAAKQILTRLDKAQAQR